MIINEITNKPIIIVMVGIPGMGKSTLINKLKQSLSEPIFVYSTDNYIEQQASAVNSTYNDVFKDQIKSATSYMNSQLREAVKNNSNIIWDQTNLSSKKRNSILSNIPNHYHKECHCIIPPQNDEQEHLLNKRLQSRKGKNIPDHVIAQMKENFEIPSMIEGWDNITFYNIHGEIS